MSTQESQHLDIGSFAADPTEQFGRWYDEVQATGVSEPEICCLSTATPEARPSARIVLLKGFDSRGVQASGREERTACTRVGTAGPPISRALIEYPPLPENGGRQ